MHIYFDYTFKSIPIGLIALFPTRSRDNANISMLKSYMSKTISKQAPG